MDTYDRPVTGGDVAGAAAAFAHAGVDADAVRVRVAADAVFADAASLRRVLPPDALGIAPGTWEAVFGPLFGEFE